MTNPLLGKPAARPVLFLVLCLLSFPHAADGRQVTDETLARMVTIHRDEWGIPHIFGQTDVSTMFGMGYAQAEDYFWQLEDNCIRAVGRSAEVVGKDGLRNDVLNRAFEIVRRSREDFANLAPDLQEKIAGFTRGVNYYLQTHPQTKARVIERFEPWHVLAIERHFFLDFAYGRVHIGRPQAEGFLKPDQASAGSAAQRERLAWVELDRPQASYELTARAAIGSNGWAIGPAKTKSGKAMLLINPHQPWFGWGQYYESHLRSAEGWSFTGAGFYGSPIPSKGHNGHLGWTYTTNEPDIADAWRVTFDAPDQPLTYRYGGERRLAVEWTDTIRVKEKDQVREATYRFRKTHHGPVVRQEDEQTYLAIRIAKLYDVQRLQQAYRMIRATNMEEWLAAVRLCAIPMFNIVYADKAGNVFYVYNGAIPVRDTQFDWTKPLDGSDPRTQWQGFHALADLPQLLNPAAGYVQNCNSSPFHTTHDENPQPAAFPAYMMEDAARRERRAEMSRKLLREAEEVTFEQFQDLAYDTTLYWPLDELPRYRDHLERLQQEDAEFANRVRPYLEHLLDWDCRVTDASTQATLCITWFEEMFGPGYPAHTMHAEYRGDRSVQLGGLIKAARSLQRVHGDWRVSWGDVHRIQRVTKKDDIMAAAVSFNGFLPSVPCSGAPGPLGIIYTVYSTPTFPIVRTRRYAVVGTSYLAAVEFGDRVQTRSATPFGASADRASPHYFDQAKLFSQRKFKTAWFYEDEVLDHATRSYHPGEESGM